MAVKHATPCGVATASSPTRAFALAREADPVSIFGGIVALNCEVDEETARCLAGLVLDVVIAPGYTPGALGHLSKERPRLRVLAAQGPGRGPSWPGDRWEIRSVGGGLLVQERDERPAAPGEWKTVTPLRPTDEQMNDLSFAWTVVKHVRSNAIVLASGGVTTGIGGGQVNRVEACRLAVRGAGERAQGSVLASDAFIPFPDTLEVAHQAGVSAVIQPGGSVRDDEVIRAAETLGMAMVFTGVRHFKH